MTVACSPVPDEPWLTTLVGIACPPPYFFFFRAPMRGTSFLSELGLKHGLRRGLVGLLQVHVNPFE